MIRVMSSALLIAAVLLINSIYGCGNNTDNQAPDGSTITVNPTSWTFNNMWYDTIQNFQVVVKYSDGTPVPNAKLNISSDMSIQSSTQWTFYQFYFNADATNVSPNYPVTGGAFNASTNDFGVYTFSIRFAGASTLGYYPVWLDNIYVTSGTANAMVSLSTTTS